MKKMLMYILTVICILTLPVVAVGAKDDAWYTTEGDVLTVRIPLADIGELSNSTAADPAPSYDVEFTDSPQGTFELLTSEIQNDRWIASYRVTAEYSGPATLTFTITCDGDHLVALRIGSFAGRVRHGSEPGDTAMVWHL